MPTQPQSLPYANAPLLDRAGFVSVAWYAFFTRMANVVTYSRVGRGDPEGVVAAPVGAIYQRTDGGAGTTLYVKESGGGGNTGWVAK